MHPIKNLAFYYLFKKVQTIYLLAFCNGCFTINSYEEIFMKLRRIVLLAFVACLFSNVSLAVTYDQVLAKIHEPQTDTVAVQKSSKQKLRLQKKM